MKLFLLALGLIALASASDVSDYEYLIGFPGKCEDILPKSICDKIRAVKEKLGDAPADLDDELDTELMQDLPQTCEDVFSQQQCDALRAIAKRFGETADDINTAIREAAAKHLSKAQDILHYVQHFIIEHATNFKCENVLPAEQCANLEKIGKLMKLKAADVTEAIMEAIVHGATSAAEIYQQAENYIRDILSKTSCEDFISADTCTQLTNLAKVLHLNAKEVVKAVREAVIEGKLTAAEIYKRAVDFLADEVTCEGIFGANVCAKLARAAQILGEKATDIKAAVKEAISKHLVNLNPKDLLKFIQDYLVEHAVNFKCENVISAEACAKLNEIGGRLKETTADINKSIKEAIVKGADSAQEIYNVAISWLKNAVQAKTCEDLIDASTCQMIRDFANKVHVNAQEVMESVKEAIAEGASSATDIYKKAVEYIKSRISCENVMGKATCDRIRALADKFSVSLTKVDEVLREAIASGVTKVTDLYKVVVKYIMDRWTDLIGDEEMLMQNDFPDFKAILEKLVSKVLDDLKVVNQKIRASIKKAILEGKVRIAEIRQKIKDLLAKVGQQSEDEIAFSKREIVDDLKEALKKAKGITRMLIERLLAMSKEKLAEAKDLINKILKDFGIKQDSVIDVLLDSTHEQILSDLREETTAFTDMILADMEQEADSSL